MIKETPIQRSIRLALGAVDGCAFWRNNVGQASFGTARVRYGLCVGSADLIGVVVTDYGVGRFCALETKSENGRLSTEQKMFLQLVRELGGFAAVVRSVDDAIEAVERCKRGDYE